MSFDLKYHNMPKYHGIVLKLRKYCIPKHVFSLLIYIYSKTSSSMSMLCIIV
jgi:hypothetical protein